MMIKPSSTDPVVIGVSVWPQAIPQSLIGHIDLVDAEKASLSSSGHDGIFLGGNYVAGVALGWCVEAHTKLQPNSTISCRGFIDFLISITTICGQKGKRKNTQSMRERWVKSRTNRS